MDLIAPRFAERFGRSPEIQAYAPGRIEVLGNHVDYNGGNVLGAAIDRGITVAIALRTDVRARVFSESLGEDVTVSLPGLQPFTGRHSWANYPLGVRATMERDGFAVTRGFDLFVSSTLPAGAGMGSSAAFAVATAYALAALHGLELDRKRMVQICHRAETDFVGMPCGILDQAVSVFGAPNQLVQINCLTQTFNRIALPSGCHLWIIDSNKRHALVNSAYSQRRRECEEAFAILGSAIPSAVCLAQVAPEQVRAHDNVLTDVQYKRALHVTGENLRVAQAVEALHHGNLESLGALLSASHRSSQTLFENSCPEQDYLVDQLISQDGVFGARLSGGGFGGSVVALTNDTFGTSGAITGIADGYEKTFGRKVTVYHTQAGRGAMVLPG
jgi:galactokinase